MTNALYDTIGIDYNATRSADPYLTDRLYSLLEPTKEGIYLDIGCGTGNYTSAIERKGVTFCGVDPSATMLEEAQSNNNRIQWLQGSSEQIPVTDKYFTGAMATLTIHHWPSLTRGFGEVRRVLADDAKFVLFSSLPEQMEGYWLKHYFPVMFKAACKQMPSMESVENALEETGFEVEAIENYSVQPDIQDLFLYAGKYNPELYFSKEYRRGISTFSNLANAEEVETGLKRLRADIESGEFNQIREQYDNSLGDYLFIVARKKSI